MKFRSQVFTAVSGSIGGITYGHNRGGMYTRGRATPTNPNSAAQQAARNAFSSLATAWSSVLTVAQRGAWEQYAANTPTTDVFGEPLTLTGQQMYNRCNAPRVRAGVARVDDGPATFGMADLSPCLIAFSTPNVAILWDTDDLWANDPLGVILVQTSMIVSRTINSLKSPYRLESATVGNATTPPSGYSEGSNAFGMPYADYAGNRVFVKIRCSNADGRLSPVQTLQVDV